MNSRLDLRYVRSASAAVGILVLLMGCGGGGGSNPARPEPDSPQISEVAWSMKTLTAERDIFATAAGVPVDVALTLRSTGGAYWFRYSYDKSLADVTHSQRTADSGLDFRINFHTFPVRPVGSYSDTLTVQLCYDEACTRVVQGSPFKLPMRLDVGYLARAEEGVPLLNPTQTTVLKNDVVGAAYSKAFDAVVTVSTRPDSTLRLFDVRTGLVRSISLPAAPTALSLSADGRWAAVGHDAFVSLLDLSERGAPSVRRFEVPMRVGALALAGQRIVAIGAQQFGWNPIYWIDTISGESSRFDTTSGAIGVSGMAEVVLHPDGERVYLADSGSSPDEIWRIDLSGDAATGKAHDSPYHGDYPFCHRLAVSPDGRRIYTGCGTILSAAQLPSADLRYAGRLRLSATDAAAPVDFKAVSIDVAPGSDSVALLEAHETRCDPRLDQLDKCFTRLAVYDAATLERRSLRSLAPYVRNGDRLQQWGRRVMYRPDGSLIVLAEARTKDESVPTWLMHLVSP